MAFPRDEAAYLQLALKLDGPDSRTAHDFPVSSHEEEKTQLGAVK